MQERVTLLVIGGGTIDGSSGMPLVFLGVTASAVLNIRAELKEHFDGARQYGC